MSFGINIVGDASQNVAEVNDSKELKVALSQAATDAGFAKMLDSQGNELLVTEHGYLNVSTDDLIFVEQVDGAALNTNKWTTSTSGMTIVQAGGYIALNSGGTTAATNYAILQSVRSIPCFSYLPLKVSFNALATTLPQPNATMELGIGVVAGSSTPTDGAFFRWNNVSEFRAVVNNNGSETVSAALIAPPINDATLLDIVIVEDAVQFFVDDVLVAAVDVPVALSYPTNSGRMPLFARVITSPGSAALPPKLNIGQVVAVQQGLSQDKPWNDTLASIGLGSYQSPVTAFTQTANDANSTAVVSGTLSNTTAAYTTLGGQFQFAAVAGAVTDFALFAYQVPANYQLYINSIAIASMNTGATVASVPSTLDWSIGVNGSGQSLATAESPPTSWASRRIPVGMQGFVVGALAGTMANDIERTFTTPLVVDGGRYFHAIVQLPSGTATASQVIRGDVMINGYFE